MPSPTSSALLVAKLRDDELFGPLLSEKLIYYPTVTREPFRNRGRITDLISSEQLFNDIHQPPLNIETDRVMMCGSPAMLAFSGRPSPFG